MATERNKEMNISEGNLHSPSEADITDDQRQGREEVSGGISRAVENEGIAAESPQEATKEENTDAQSPQLEEWVGENPNATEAISTPHEITQARGENRAATQTKQVTEERSSSSSQATEDIASESPQPTEEAEITEEIPQATSEEMTTVTSERPPATETESFPGPEPRDNVASEMPKATKGVGGESPQDAGNGSVVYETPLAVEGVVAEWAPRAEEGERSTPETQSPQSADVPCKSPPAAEDEMSVAGESQGVTAMGHTQEEEEEEEEMTGRAGETGHAGEEEDNRVPPGSQEGAEEVATAGGSQEAMEEKSSTTDMSSEAAEEGDVPTECPSSTEERHADGERPLAEKAPGATGEQPQAVAPKGGEGARRAHERPQLRERTSVKAESPPQAPGGGQVCGQSTWQGAKLRVATHPGRLAVVSSWGVSKQIQDSLKLFLRHSQPRLHGYCKPLKVFGARSVKEGKVGSPSDLQKEPQGHRTELRLQVGHGGRITSCVTSSSVSPKHHLSVVTSLGGSGQGGSLSRSPCCKGRALQGTSELRFILGMSLQDPGTFREPQEECGILPPPPQPKNDKQECGILLPPPPLAQPKDYEHDARPSDNQLINSLERSSLDSSVESALGSCIETLLWDKEKISEWLDCSLRRMMQNRHHPVEPMPSSPSPEIVTRSTCMGHSTVYQKSRTSPYGTDAHQSWQQQEEAPAMAKGAGSSSCPSPERNKTQEEPSLSFAESRVDVHLPEQEGLLKSSEGAASGLLGAHISLRTLGSFVHPPHATSSQSTHEAMVPRQGKECQESLRGQIHGGKASLELSAAGRVGPPFQTQEDHRALYAPAEPRGWADGQRGEVGTGLKRPSPPLSVSGTSLEQQQQQHNAFLQAAEGSREASCEGSEASGDSKQHLSSGCFLGTGEEFPAPPSDWFHSDAEETGVERMPRTSSISASEGTFLKTPPEPPPPLCPLPVEDRSPSSTERKREGVRHRGSKAIHSRESLAREEPCADDDQNVGERPGAGSCPKAAEAARRPQRETASPAEDAEKRLFIISAILEAKLNLKQGLHIWLQSQERRRVAWRGGIRPGAPTASCLEDEEEVGKTDGFRIDPRGGADPAAKGGVSKRQTGAHSVAQGDKEARRTGISEAHLSPAENTRSQNRPGLSASSASNPYFLGRPFRMSHSRERSMGPDSASASTRSRSKASGARSCGGREGRRQKTPSPGRLSRRGAGGRDGALSSRKTRLSTRGTERPLSSASSSEDWRERPLGLQAGTPPGKGGRLHQRQVAGPVIRVRFAQQCFAHVKDRKAAAPSGQMGAPLRGQPKSSAFSQSGVLEPRHEDCHAPVASGHIAPEVSHAGDPGRSPHPRGSAFTRHVGRQSGAPSEDPFRNLKEKILSRRRAFWSSTDSEEVA